MWTRNSELQNEKILCLLKNRVIKQVYKKVVEDLEKNVETILNLYINRVDDFIDSLDDDWTEKNI